MKPRIFVSSTFYDLKYIREDLANFIRAHDFEPILFEDGDIGYIPFNNLDDSCYKAMASADMALLIVGGNYGSAASGEAAGDFKEFISITRREFQKGVEQGVPFFVFIDRNVYAEYGIYELNSKEIESGECSLKFKATKNINVFRFIREIRNIKQIAITEFDKVADIKDFLSKQWADMFKLYLASIKSQKEIEQIQESLGSMKLLVEKMDKILDAVVKEVLKDSEEEYQQLVKKTDEAELKAICKLIAKFITAKVVSSISREVCAKTFLTELSSMYAEQIDFATQLDIPPEDISTTERVSHLLKSFHKRLEEKGILATSINYQICEKINEIYPYLKDPEKMQKMCNLLVSRQYFEKIFDIDIWLL